MEEPIAKRGSEGGRKRAENLSKEQRSAIAKQAAKSRWAKRNVPLDKVPDLPADALITGIPIVQGGITTVDIESSPDPSEPKHCPACVAGQSLEEGEGTHILATVEHPVTLPAAFADAETVVAVPEPPAVPQKPKRTAKPMPKEFKSASSYAEKRLPQAIKEKSDHVGAVARLDAEINDLVRVIKALGGTVDTQVPQQGYPAAPLHSDPRYTPQPYQPVIQGATQVDIPSVPKRMIAGGAGALDFSGIMNE